MDRRPGSGHAGSEEFARSHRDGIPREPEIPSAHLRPPRPALERVLEDARVEAMATAYDLGCTMPAIARHRESMPRPSAAVWAGAAHRSRPDPGYRRARGRSSAIGSTAEAIVA
ncbi:MAG: hypothetical protein ACRDNY_10065 [Gaiellaceae bacterium]